MSETRSVSSQIEVAVDTGTAFSAFTQEMDLWWVRGPINFFDAARAVAMTCEPGVGGRLLEVYDQASGDALELGRITVWQPGERLSWRSSVDDVLVDVVFDRTDRGTMVLVEATIPAGTKDLGGTAWVRVVPPWFAAWCARRDGAPREPADTGRLALSVYYAKPATAARWLAEVFGLRTPGVLPDEDDGHHWIEFLVGNCSLMIAKPGDGMLAGGRAGDAPATGAAATHVPWVFVDDLDAHYATAKAGGAAIVEEISQYGYRCYVADDLEGHRWTFAQARPTMR